MFQRLMQIGPGAMVAAAFIGPGTITTATLAGAHFGYTLLWAVLFSTVSTVVLQEMTARLGVVTQVGLGQAIRQKAQSKTMRLLTVFMVIAAIALGNAAYEAGNLSGAVLGIFNQNDVLSPINWPVVGIGVVVIVLLYTSNFQWIERVLVGLVVAMGVLFFVQAIALKPNWTAVVKGLFIPQVDGNNLQVIIGLIGTTIVPYNLFLHASAVKQKWHTPALLQAARWDTFLSVGLGGLITMSIVMCAAVALHPTLAAQHATSPQNSISALLEVYKTGGFIKLGLFAAGLSSAITAPLAAAYAVTEILGREVSPKNWSFRAVWLAVVVAGVVVGSLGYKPTQIILFAQVANGLLLPVVAVFLLWVMNDKQLMQEHKNTVVTNLLGFLVVGITIALGIKSIVQALVKFIF